MVLSFKIKEGKIRAYSPRPSTKKQKFNGELYKQISNLCKKALSDTKFPSLTKGRNTWRFKNQHKIIKKYSEKYPIQIKKGLESFEKNNKEFGSFLNHIQQKIKIKYKHEYRKPFDWRIL